MAKYITYNRGLNPKITPKRENKNTKKPPKKKPSAPSKCQIP